MHVVLYAAIGLTYFCFACVPHLHAAFSLLLATAYLLLACLECRRARREPDSMAKEPFTHAR